MNTYRTIARVLLIALLLTMPLTGALALAEEGPATSEQPPAPVGIATLVFLLGAGAVVLVGGAMIARDNFRGDSDENS